MSVRSGYAILILALGLIHSSLALRSEDDSTGSGLVDVAGVEQCLYVNQQSGNLNDMAQCNAARGCLWEWIEAYCNDYTTHEENGCCLPHAQVKDPPPVVEVMGALHAAEQAVEQMQTAFEASVDRMAASAKNHASTEAEDEKLFRDMQQSKQKSRRLRDLHALVAVYEQHAQKFFNAFQEFAFSDLNLNKALQTKTEFEQERVRATLQQLIQGAEHEINSLMEEQKQKRASDALELIAIWQEAGAQADQITAKDVDHEIHPTVDGATAKVIAWARKKVVALCPNTPPPDQVDNTDVCNILTRHHNHAGL